MNPVATFIDNLTAEQERRHSWLLKAAEQIREQEKKGKTK